MDYKEEIKERIKILPERLRTFLLDENWRKDAENIGKKFNFDENKYTLFENEVFLVLLCFEPRKDLAENLKNELGIDANMADWIKEDVNKNIFSKVESELGAIEKQIEENEKKESSPDEMPEEARPQSKVGESFEQIILNQARAMQPAIDEQRREVPPNLPIKEEKPRAIHNYVAGQDPYREPVE